MPSARTNNPIKSITWMPTENIVRNGFSNPMLLPSATVQLLHAHCPDDFNAIVDVTMRLEKLAGPTGAQNIDLDVHMGGDGEDKATRTASDSATTYTIASLTQLTDFDITALFSSMLASDNLGIRLINQESDGIYCYFITLRYT
jgi:hypothetical protein